MKSRGFTIVELLIVIVVIAILATITVLAFNGIQQRARDASRLSDVQSTVKKIELYYAENGRYPSTGGLTVVYADSKCTNSNPNKRADWVPGITGLPQSLPPRTVGYGCYLYASDGSAYIVSAWDALETGPQTSTLYRRMGFRETVFSANDLFYCNTAPSFNSYWDNGFYKHSYTVTNITTCSESGY